MSNIKKTAQEKGVLFYGDEIVNYDIIRRVVALKNEKTKANKVVIKVHPDQQVVAIAPECASAEDIQDAMIKRARWIFESLTSFSSQHEYVMPRQYVSGETQFYLGRRYVLKVMIDASQPPCVKLYRGKLTVSLKKDSVHKVREVKALLEHWYASHARTVFHARLCELLPKATWAAGMPSYRIMPMKKQWGSCSKKGRLMLNPHLVKAPKECIDYVILHELCHIAVYNHSDKFWKLLTQVMPNWKEVKAKLDSMAELYLNE